MIVVRVFWKSTILTTRFNLKPEEQETIGLLANEQF